MRQLGADTQPIGAARSARRCGGDGRHGHRNIACRDFADAALHQVDGANENVVEGAGQPDALAHHRPGAADRAAIEQRLNHGLPAGEDGARHGVEPMMAVEPDGQGRGGAAHLGPDKIDDQIGRAWFILIGHCRAVRGQARTKSQGFKAQDGVERTPGTSSARLRCEPCGQPGAGVRSASSAIGEAARAGWRQWR